MGLWFSPLVEFPGLRRDYRSDTSERARPSSHGLQSWVAQHPKEGVKAKILKPRIAGVMVAASRWVLLLKLNKVCQSHARKICVSPN